MLGEDERARDRRSWSTGVAGVHSSASLPGGERRLELVPGQDRQVVEQPQPGRERRREPDDDRRRIGCARPGAACRRPSSDFRSELWTAGRRRAANENSTSSEVNGAPSEKCAGRSVSV